MVDLATATFYSLLPFPVLFYNFVRQDLPLTAAKMASNVLPDALLSFRHTLGQGGQFTRPHAGVL